MTKLASFAQHLVDRCLQSGATAAEIVLSEGTASEIEIRNGRVDKLASGQPQSISIRVWRQDRVASTRGTAFDEQTVSTLIQDALALSELSDPIDGLTLAPAHLLTREFPDLDLWDDSVLQRATEDKIAQAIAAEKAALDADARITVSDGASYSDGTSHDVLATSEGFVGETRSTWSALGAQAIADDANDRKRNGSWYSVARHASDLLTPEDIGQRAATRAIAQLGASPIPTAAMPVVFDPYMAASLFGSLFGALTGGAIERGSSFLADAEHTQIASERLTLIDDPTLLRGLGSRQFDGEGLPSKKTEFVKDGRLTTFAFNTYHAHKMSRTPTGHATRSGGGAPGEGPSNLYVQPGALSPQELIASIPYGFYCQSMMGFGVNLVTGDFSRGASGFLIENGRLTRPVSEVTLSGNFKDMLMQIDGIGNDLRMDRSICSPTIVLRNMTLGGT